MPLALTPTQLTWLDKLYEANCSNRATVAMPASVFRSRGPNAPQSRRTGKAIKEERQKIMFQELIEEYRPGNIQLPAVRVVDATEWKEITNDCNNI